MSKLVLSWPKYSYDTHSHTLPHSRTHDVITISASASRAHTEYVRVRAIITLRTTTKIKDKKAAKNDDRSVGGAVDCEPLEATTIAVIRYICECFIITSTITSGSTERRPAEK